ncbi:MAG TPA: hypothetical protein VMV24_01080 [Candidatus Dormibacteraeota bacterium]|nr:hypothetical protein [Candidatus Dormibacteraeota bacterium]
MTRRHRFEAGFSLITILLFIVVIIAVSTVGMLVYRHYHISKTIPSVVTHSRNTLAPQKYLVIKEWGVELPLSSPTTTSYYVVNTAMSKDPDGLPGSVWLGLKILDTSNCNPANNNSGGLATIP